MTLASFYFSITACSNHPEIKPYEAPQIQELAVDESSNDLELPDSADGFLEDADVSGEESPAERVAVKEQVIEEKATPEKVITKIEKKQDVKNRAPASALKNGYYTTSEVCDMKASPSEKSASVGNVSKGKKLWLDAHNGSWLKAYKKKGTAYIPAHCVQ